MKIKKITQMLILISITVVFFDLIRLDLWGKDDLLYLIWNLFLAWIPYVISKFFIKKDMPTGRFVIFFIFWLIFFPNAPYLVTDVLHIAGRFSSFLWYDSLLFFFFGWIGLFLGMLSLLEIHQYLKTRLSYIISEIIIFAICVISSFGIYLGRFERWNSWDIFINPFHLIKDSFNVSINTTHSGTPLIFVSVFTIFMYFIYKTIYVLVVNKDK
jgi:uncharacterized membrane protein